jgi:hypothetical protein
MSAVKALQSARDCGVVVEVSGGDLLLAAPIEPPAKVVEDLARYKREIIGILTPKDSGPTAEDWLISFNERAGIAEFDGAQPRELAERQAIGSCVLDEAMGKTSGKEIERFVRWLSDHINRAQRSLGGQPTGTSTDPGAPRNLETTP